MNTNITYLIILLIAFISISGRAYGQVFDKEPDVKLLTVPKDLKDSTRVNPVKFLPVLTEKLIYGVTDEFKKVKIIHDWITTEIRYDTEPYLRYSELIAETYDVLRYKRGICVGYCNVFNKMCSYANIESVSIVGVAKPPYITEEYLPEQFRELNHMWNAVKVYGKWYLIDLTWDAGYTLKREFIFRYSTAYLFADPKLFITHHYPKEEKWQLLDNPVTWSQFRRTEFEEPYDKLSLNKNTLRGGITFSRLFNSGIPDLNETTGFNLSFSADKGLTNELAMEFEFTFDHMKINQDPGAFQSYVRNSNGTVTDPVTGKKLSPSGFGFEKIGVGFNLKYHLKNETSLLPFLKSGVSVSTPFSFSSEEAGILVREPGGSERIHEVNNFGLFDQILYGVLLSAGADLVRRETSKNNFIPVMGVELRWSFLLNSIRLFKDYDEGHSMLKSYSINFMFYL